MKKRKVMICVAAFGVAFTASPIVWRIRQMSPTERQYTFHFN